jgi:hypothetical protein
MVGGGAVTVPAEIEVVNRACNSIAWNGAGERAPESNAAAEVEQVPLPTSGIGLIHL